MASLGIRATCRQENKSERGCQWCVQCACCKPACSGRPLLRYCGRSRIRLKNNHTVKHLGNLNAWTTSQVPWQQVLAAVPLCLYGTSSQCAVQAAGTPQMHITSKSCRPAHSRYARVPQSCVPPSMGPCCVHKSTSTQSIEVHGLNSHCYYHRLENPCQKCQGRSKIRNKGSQGRHGYYPILYPPPKIHRNAKTCTSTSRIAPTTPPYPQIFFPSSNQPELQEDHRLFLSRAALCATGSHD
ncbi:hypothetical protein CONLIGDRAFT_422507 [Coniochaeta ligniaria NRRL 30616]|uniref:Uncharacterized protein n=1 Tax=Coniochaeta ligniaria NRRL 30616 TaxID=1408157 RepID=A0A1J7IJ29_9PEZI|nr:hypothetical protein CONLIGDRAFT_422507 [Coniochaeta ligniaria NRRL 30616]